MDSGQGVGGTMIDKINEQDPHGKNPHEAGAKLDAGKNRLGMVLLGFSRALMAVGVVGTYGASKYSDNGWMAVPDGVARYTDAMYRHQVTEGFESHEPSTGLLHAAQGAWNALARLELMLREGVQVRIAETATQRPETALGRFYGARGADTFAELDVALYGDLIRLTGCSGIDLTPQEAVRFCRSLLNAIKAVSPDMGEWDFEGLGHA